MKLYRKRATHLREALQAFAMACVVFNCGFHHLDRPSWLSWWYLLLAFVDLSFAGTHVFWWATWKGPDVEVEIAVVPPEVGRLQ